VSVQPPGDDVIGNAVHVMRIARVQSSCRLERAYQFANPCSSYFGPMDAVETSRDGRPAFLPSASQLVLPTRAAEL